MTSPAPDIAKAYCNCLAQERGLSPIGHADYFEDALIIETPLPWPMDMMQKAGALPQPVVDLLALWVQDYREGKGYPHRPMVVAPDPVYSQRGYRRVMFYTRPTGLFAQFNKVEYLLPTEEVGALVWSLYQDREALSQFERYRVPEAETLRDLLVCTHGTVDAACAKFGYPLYKHMRDRHNPAAERVWRVSHFGGHVFAPTMMDMPTGHYWGYVGAEQADQIMRRDGDTAALQNHYRGWAGAHDGFEQVAEYDLWQQHGWEWIHFPRQAAILAQEDTSAPQWAEVEITYTRPDGTIEAATRSIEITRSIETITTTGNAHTYAYPQYRVKETAEA